MIRAEVNEAGTVAKLRLIPGNTLAEIKNMVAELTNYVMRRSVRDKLSGQVLKRRTGTLARSVTQSPRTYLVGNTLVVGTVGTVDLTGPGGRQPVKYGAMHEYGFHGTVNVREHLRHLREHGRVSLKAVKDKEFGMWQHQRGRLTGGVAVVSAHQREMNIPARSFLRTALAEVMQAGGLEQERAFDRAAREALRKSGV